MKIKLLFAFLSTLFFVVGCSTKSENDKAIYPIGAVLPLTGDCANASQEIINGMKVACDEINARGGIAGINVKLVVKDSRSSDTTLLETFDSMRRHGVKVFNLGFGKETIFTKKLISSCEDVFVNYMCSYPPITIDMPNSTRIFINGAQVGDIMASAVKRTDDSTIQIVSMNVDDFFGKADGDYLAFNLKLPKTKFYRDVFGEGEKNFTIFGEQIMRLYAEYVFYVGYGSELQAFTDSLIKAGYQKTIVANCGLIDDNFKVSEKIKLLKVEPLFAQGKVNNSVSKKFVASYKSMFGSAPTWKSAYGYDSIMLLARAVEKSRFMPSKMRDYFTNLKYEGAVGKLEFDKTADSISELSLVKK